MPTSFRFVQRQKQEALLKRAVRAFDLLNLRDGIYRLLYRIQLADIYKSQQRFEEQRAILKKLSSMQQKIHNLELGISNKIQTNLLLGELNCNSHHLDQAELELSDALSWTREHLPKDLELRRNCMNALIHLYRSNHNKVYEKKANLLAKESKKITDSLDFDSSKY